jgi:hypothetical protein
MHSTPSVKIDSDQKQIRRHHQQLSDPVVVEHDHTRRARELVVHEHAQTDPSFDHANAQDDPAEVAAGVVLTPGESRPTSTPRLQAQAGCSVCARLLVGEEHQGRCDTATDVRGSGCLQAEFVEDRVEVLLNGPLRDHE